MRRHRRLGLGRLAPTIGAVIATIVVAGCAAPEGETPVAGSSPVTEARRSLDPPAAEGAFAPRLWADESGLAMTWLEPLGSERKDGHRVRFASLDGDDWSEPSTIVEGRDLFANWADFPGVARDANGNLVAHWLAKTADETYAYSIFLARSADGGVTWEATGKLNDDSTHTEHGFVSWLRGDAGLRAVWLDGRQMADGGPMTLRSAAVDGSSGRPLDGGVVLDERVCECCSTDATWTAAGPLAVYRDRSDDEVRDTFAVGWRNGGWSAPAPVASEAWRIEGCPVNGPAVAAAESTVTSAWFTAADDRPRVVAAVSRDSGESFGDPVVLDDDLPLGRVDVAMLDDGVAAVAWVGRAEGQASVNLRRFYEDGALGEVLRVGKTSMARASGFPRLARVGDVLLVAWVELGDDRPSRVRLDEIAVAAIPSRG